MSDSDLRDEFRNLGENLTQAFNTAWESDKRKRLQEEMQEGLSELGTTLKELGSQIKESEVIQKVQDDVEDLGEGVRSGAGIGWRENSRTSGSRS